MREVTFELATYASTVFLHYKMAQSSAPAGNLNSSKPKKCLDFQKKKTNQKKMWWNNKEKQLFADYARHH